MGMSTGRNYHNVALIGFMGVGKTTVGHLLATLLGFELVDTDRLIERREGCRISEIFSTRGEAWFRKLETEICNELANMRGKVISTGGGLGANPDNLKSLQSHALIVCLWASPETVYRRVCNQDHRPLLKTENPLERIRELMAQRAPFYQKADILVGVDYRSPAETARFIAGSFRRASGGDATGGDAGKHRLSLKESRIQTESGVDTNSTVVPTDLKEKS
jgi:shikimate kinase